MVWTIVNYRKALLDKLHVLIPVCSTISKLRFNGCYHPCWLHRDMYGKFVPSGKMCVIKNFKLYYFTSSNYSRQTKSHTFKTKYPSCIPLNTLLT